MLANPIGTKPSFLPRYAKSGGKYTLPRLQNDSNDGGPRVLSPTTKAKGFSVKAKSLLFSTTAQELVTGWNGVKTTCLLLVSVTVEAHLVQIIILETDVIMVWHAYMLNPRDFLEDCLRQGKMKFWRAGLPWATIDPCINNNTFEYSPSDAAINYFEDKTGNKWNNLDDPPNAAIECPLCKRNLYDPWTRWDSRYAWTKTSSSENAAFCGESQAAGFSDKKFEVQCQCGIVIDHELQRTQKFRKDIQALHNMDVPMPGTILNDTGVCFCS